MKKVKFNDWVCEAKLGKYPDGSRLLYLTDAEEFIGERIATCSVYLDNRPKLVDRIYKSLW